MDFYSSKIPSSYRLITILFRILAVSMLILTILFFILVIEETVKITTGEIYSENAPKQYLSPLEAEIDKILTYEGAKVLAGDTLIILKSDLLNNDINRIKKEIEYKKSNLDLVYRKLNNIDDKINIQHNELSIVEGNSDSNRKNLENEVATLEQLLASLSIQLEKSRIIIKKDKELLSKRAISEREFNSKEKSFQEEESYYAMKQNEYYSLKNNLDNFDQELMGNIEKQNLSINSSQSQRLDLEKNITQQKSEIYQLRQELESKNVELNRLNIIAETNGYASAIFNLKKNLNFIDKGQNLITISPIVESEFFARLTLNEKEMKDVKIGQRAKIKVDAFNHFQFGVLDGEVIQINKDELNIFYVIAKINNDKNFDLKSGYKVKGEVVLDNIKLSQYVFNKVFRTI